MESVRWSWHAAMIAAILGAGCAPATKEDVRMDVDAGATEDAGTSEPDAGPLDPVAVPDVEALPEWTGEPDPDWRLSDGLKPQPEVLHGTVGGVVLPDCAERFGANAVIGAVIAYRLEPGFDVDAPENEPFLATVAANWWNDWENVEWKEVDGEWVKVVHTAHRLKPEEIPDLNGDGLPDAPDAYYRYYITGVEGGMEGTPVPGACLVNGWGNLGRYQVVTRSGG